MGNVSSYDRIIIGAGLYGLYAARLCALRNERVLVLEYDPEPFARATYINQARVHMGYHYPRSLSTAVKSAGYFRRFNEDYSFCIHSRFDQIYATSAQFSWTNAKQFLSFCRAAQIRCEEISPNTYFKPGMCDGAFLTEEYTYDAHVLRDFYMKELSGLSGAELVFNARISSIRRRGDDYVLRYSIKGAADIVMEAAAPFVLNATYASTNQILKLLKDGMEEDQKEGKTPAAGEDSGTALTENFGIKYELCEIILCNVSDELKGKGITVMDGPFFSIMPFGLTGQHSLTSVTFTPHVTCYEDYPEFSCQKGADCTPGQLGNCNTCPNRPGSAWPYMSHLADKYLKEEYAYTYDRSLFSMKPILRSSEVDDSRPTAIRVNTLEPTFISVLSGKINTVYDLDEYLERP